jgi:DNA-binding transcriptional MerR regulator
MQVDPDVRSQLKEMGFNLDELSKQLEKHVEPKPEVSSGISASGKDSLRKLVERVQRLRPKDLTADKAKAVLGYIEGQTEPNESVEFNPEKFRTQTGEDTELRPLGKKKNPLGKAKK